MSDDGLLTWFKSELRYYWDGGTDAGMALEISRR